MYYIFIMIFNSYMYMVYAAEAEHYNRTAMVKDTWNKI